MRNSPFNEPDPFQSRPHRFETAIGDARLWGVFAVLGVAIAFSRRSANSDFAVWTLLIIATLLVLLITNTHRTVRYSKQRLLLTLITGIVAIPLVIVFGGWLTAPAGTSEQNILLRLILNLIRVLANLQWRWILPSFAVGAAAAAVLVFLALRRAKSNMTPKLAILIPLNRWNIGSPFTIRGSITPPESGKVQLLIQPAGQAWELCNDVEVNGGTWACNYRFGNASYYKILAVLGDSLKQQSYDQPPAGVIKSEEIAVYRRAHEEGFIDCPDKRLHQTKIDDRNAMRDLVIVCGIQYRRIAEGREPAHVVFAFVVLNISLHDVSVVSVEGYVHFTLEGESYQAELPPKLKQKEKASNFGFRRTAYFEIRQDFETDREADYVLDAKEAVFQFSTLKIKVDGDSVDSFYLNTEIGFTKKDGKWVTHDDAGDFAFVGIAEASAEVRRLEVELEREKSARESSERIAGQYKDDVLRLESQLKSEIEKTREQSRHLERLSACPVKLEIDAEQSRIHVAEGVIGCTVSADIRLRFENSAITPRTIKTLRIGLYERNSGTGRQINSRKLNNHVFFPEDDLGPLSRKGFEPMQIKAGTLTHFFRFKMELAIDSLGSSDLTNKHFLLMTMTAMEQPAFSLDINVDWPRSLASPNGVAPEVRED